MVRARTWACVAATAVGVLAAAASQRGQSAERDAPVAGASERMTPLEAGDKAGEKAAEKATTVSHPPARPGTSNAIGSEAFAALTMTPAQRRALHDVEQLDPSGTGRVLGEFMLSGYHYETLENQMGASMKVFADERLARLARRPEETMTLIRAVRRLPSLAGPELAYSRATLLTAAGRMPGQREATHELARADLAAAALPILPKPPLGSGNGEPTPMAADEPTSLPLYTALTFAHAVFLDTAGGQDESVNGTAAAIRAQDDPSLRLRLARQLLSAHPSAQGQLETALAGSGIHLGLQP